jgi:hypothetical protein
MWHPLEKAGPHQMNWERGRLACEPELTQRLKLESITAQVLSQTSNVHSLSKIYYR